MKKINLLTLFLITRTGHFFYSCNSTRHYEFSNRTEAYHSEKVLAKANQPVVEELKAAAETKQIPTNLSASTDAVIPDAIQPLPEVQLAEVSREKVTGFETVKSTNTTLTKANKKELKQAFKQFKKQNKGAEISGKPTVDALELILAIFLPPIGVLLHEGGLNIKFWISLILTLLFFFPGMIYAILVVTDTI